MIDKKAIEEHIRGILVALGEDPDREGLKETPKRVADMYEEVFASIGESNDDIAVRLAKTFEDEEQTEDKDRVVVMKDIDMFSFCEHHMALMYDMKATGPIFPKGESSACPRLPEFVMP